MIFKTDDLSYLWSFPAFPVGVVRCCSWNSVIAQIIVLYDYSEIISLLHWRVCCCRTGDWCHAETCCTQMTSNTGNRNDWTSELWSTEWSQDQSPAFSSSLDHLCFCGLGHLSFLHVGFGVCKLGDGSWISCAWWSPTRSFEMPQGLQQDGRGSWVGEELRLASSRSPVFNMCQDLYGVLLNKMYCWNRSGKQLD